MTLYLILAAVGAVLIAAGVGLWSSPAGLVTAGAELLAAAYVGAYFKNGGEVKP